MNAGSATGEKIGILGGTFNPIHLGHLVLAQNAIETCNLSRLFFIPCSRPPHKDPGGLLPGGTRLQMVEAAIEADPRFAVSDVEIRRGGISYAIDTVRELRESYPGAQLFFVIGDDTLLELHLWKSIETLLGLCTFATFRRHRDAGSIAAGEIRLPPPWPERLLRQTANGHRIGISSSDIRHRVAEGMSIRYLVPEAVEMYIAEHGLYRGRAA